MKEFINKYICKILDILFFGLGTFLFFTFLFDFFHSRGRGGHYYYDEGAQFGIAIGATLIVFGFLIRSWRSK